MRPEIVSTLSRPPCAAGGILVNSMDGPRRVSLTCMTAVQDKAERQKQHSLLQNADDGLEFHAGPQKTCETAAAFLWT
jgi:hypothetical protein